MAYEVKLMINGEKETFKRTEAPFLIDQTNALILSQHQMKTFGSDNITDKALLDNAKDIAKFASNFFGGQFTIDDFIHGAHNDAISAVNAVLKECMDPDDNDDDGEAKK